MRLAVFCNDFWPVVGGVPTATRGLAGAMSARGHEVLVLTRQPGGCPSRETVEGFEVERLNWNLRPRATFPVRFLRTRGALWSLAACWAPEAVYVHFVSVHAVYAWDVARRLGVPLVLSFRGNDAMRIAGRSPLTRIVYGRLTARAAVNLFCSEWLRAQTASANWFRGRPDSTGVLADAVTVQDRRARAVPVEPYVLAAGRLVHKKGFDLLLRAWSVVGGRLPLRLVIAGDGPERPALERLARELGSDATFLGPVPHPELLGLLERASLCAVPSREEPYGIIVLEAQALGVPVVATDAGNLPMLIRHSQTGYLVSPTAEALAEGILAAWTDPTRGQVASAGRCSPAATRSYATMAAELEQWIRVGHADGPRVP